MSYKALARKWRPKNFDEVVGQAEAVAVLRNALSSKRIHHAYLFTGTRGVGKTTMARIFAKALNCEKGVSDIPCGGCYSCIGIDNNNMVDLIEVDAASRTKVEETRELLDNVQYAPSQGRFKIYLIDEIHMFSKHSFNALLKTLEEPPEHVKFLLATTDHEKIPATVLSRCLKLNLKKISQNFLVEYIEKVLVGEDIKFSKDVANIIAESADGSARDALSLLDRAIVLSHGEIETAAITKQFGIIDKKILLEIFELLTKDNRAKLFDLSRSMATLAPNYDLLIDQMLSIVKQIAVFQLTQDSSQITEDVTKISVLAKKMDAELCQLFFEICLLSKRNLVHSINHSVAFDIMLVRLLTFKTDLNRQSYNDNTSFEESNINSISNNITTRDRASLSNVSKEKKNKNFKKSESINEFSWFEIVEEMCLEGLPGELARNSEMISKIDKDIKLRIPAKFQHLNQDAYVSPIEEKLASILDSSFKISVSIEKSKTIIDSPANKKKVKREEETAKERRRLLSRSPIQGLQETFDAKLGDLDLKEE